VSVLSQSAVRVEVLGSVRAFVTDTEVKLGPSQQRSVFAVLALRANRVVSVSELVDAVWGDRPPATARGIVHTYVSGLRHVLEPGRSPRMGARWLTSDGSGYSLELPADALDAEVFSADIRTARDLVSAGDRAGALQRIDAALQLWRGAPLLGATGPFVEAERAHLSELRWAVIEQRAELLLESDEHTNLVPELTEAVDREPMRERLSVLLMLALYRMGRQGDALAVFDRTRGVLADELGIDPGPDLSNMRDRILRADPALNAASRRSVRPAVVRVPNNRTRIVAPAQLPHEVPGFVGRLGELTRLTAMSLPALQLSADSSAAVSESAAARPAVGPAVVISAIAGTAGVGKTALAVQFAWQVADRFPHGQLFVNLRGFDPGRPPVSTGEALTQLLSGLGVSGPASVTDVDELAALYRTELAGRRLLVVLDNAASSGQVRDLLPGEPGCLVIVTSRNELGGLVARDGAQRLALGVLSEDEAITLLNGILGTRSLAEPEAVAELARLCGHLPLALRVAAERVSSRPERPIADLVAELADGRARLDALATEEDDQSTSVRAVFSWSYTALNTEAAHLFRLLSFHPGPDFSLAAAAAMTGWPLADARRQLRSLVSAHLVEAGSTDRYRYHDLLRLYAGERAGLDETAESNAEGIRRLLTWYLHRSTSAFGALVPRTRPIAVDEPPADVPDPSFENAEQARAWCHAESIVLLGAVRLAIDSGNGELAWKLSSSLNPYLFEGAPFDDLIAAAEAGAAAAERLGDKGALAICMQRLSVTYNAAGHSADSIRCAQASVVLFRETADRTRVRGPLIMLAFQLARLGRLDEALDYALEARAACQETGAFEGATLEALGDIYAEMGRYAEAIDHGQQALAAARTVGDEFRETSALGSLGRIYGKAGQLHDSLESYLGALAIERRKKGHLGEGLALLAAADTYRQLGDLTAARSHALAALTIFEDRGARHSAEAKALLDYLDAADTPNQPATG